MKKISILVVFITCSLFSFETYAAKIKVQSVSDNPIFAFTNPNAKVNVIGFVGGAGIKKGVGKSQNPLARDRKSFKRAGMNYYIFPNPKTKKAISLKYRKSKDHVKKISNLLEYLKKENNLPTILVGHSRGSVSVAAAANNLGKEIVKGIVIMGSLTATSKKITSPFTMSSMLKKTSVPVLIIHHRKDGCEVTPFAPTKSLSKKKGFPLVAISGGGSTGNPCGPLHYHGFEGTMNQVIDEIKKWAEAL
ncbi:MAG: hypothetical protein CMI85_01385 [Candidatus Pelagibacter sp.]|nr:hypothetical protein [Candidatus Pelagibacter sp.]|tara:strand:+ start:2496 stop:3239 length:744 start_codon:yes stop_codon:yes gene_type:complete